MQIFRFNLVNNHGTKKRLGDARQRDTTPDLTWTSKIYTYHHKWKCLSDSWGSDHFPIFFEFSPAKKIRDRSKRRVAKTLHWDKFRETLEKGNFEGFSFDSLLNSALQGATITTNVDEYAPNLDLHLLRLWAKRLQVVQKYRKGSKTPQGRHAITRATVEAKEYAQQLDTRRWLNCSSSLSDKTSITKLWATNRALLGKKKVKGATLTLALKMNKTEEQLAGIAGDLFFPQPNVNDCPSPYDVEILAPEDGMDRPFTSGELEWALQKGKSRSAPGPDKITMTMLEILPEYIKEQLLEWANHI